MCSNEEDIKVATSMGVAAEWKQQQAAAVVRLLVH
jgi:hypothetical protein